MLFYLLKKSLDAAAGDGSLLLICRSSAAPARTDPNIYIRMLILLDTRCIITPKYGKTVFLLLDTITYEKTVKLKQFDTIAITITRHPVLANSNIFGSSNAGETKWRTVRGSRLGM